MSGGVDAGVAGGGAFMLLSSFCGNCAAPIGSSTPSAVTIGHIAGVRAVTRRRCGVRVTFIATLRQPPVTEREFGVLCFSHLLLPQGGREEHQTRLKRGHSVLRKLVSALAVAFVVTLGSAGTAMAAPYSPPTVAGDRIPGNEGTVQILGSGFGTEDGPDDFVTVSVLINGVTTDYTLQVDADGNFIGEIPGVGDNAAYITIVGNKSGKTKTVNIAGVSQSIDPTTTAVVITTVQVPTTVAVPTTVNGVVSTAYVPSNVTSVATIGGMYNSGSGSSGGGTQGVYSAGGSYNGGLANTGASIAGPMAVGIGTLTAGLGLLFFGTRGVIRRRGKSLS